MKKLKKFVICSPLIFMLCSFAPRMGTYGTVGLTLCSYSQYTSSGSTSSGIGHSFVILENNRSWTLDLGFYTLNPFAKITIGLWGNDGFTENSSGGSLNSDVDGVFYNREAYAFTYEYIMPTDMVRLYKEVETGVFLDRIDNYQDDLNYLQAKAESYQLIGYNCSNFAAEFFSKACAMYFGVIASPEVLKTAMLLQGGKNDNSQIFSSNTYRRYTLKGNIHVYPKTT